MVMDRNLPRIITKRFAVVCEAMGWNYKEPRWSNVDVKSVSQVHHYSLQRHGRADKWEVNATVNEAGGETVIKAVCNGDEMLAWLDGILLGLGHVDATRVRQAWARVVEDSQKAAA